MNRQHRDPRNLDRDEGNLDGRHLLEEEEDFIERLRTAQSMRCDWKGVAPSSMCGVSMRCVAAAVRAKSFDLRCGLGRRAWAFSLTPRCRRRGGATVVFGRMAARGGERGPSAMDSLLMACRD
jgi:hypothetical protein